MSRKAKIITVLILLTAFLMPRTKVTHEISGERVLGEMLNLEFEMIGKSTYDPTSIYKYWRWKPGTPITLWDSISKEIWMQKASETEKFEPPESIDFSCYNVILSYGREILDIEYRSDSHYGANSCVLFITFSEVHDGNIVYFYKVEKMSFVPWDLEPGCYIMKGEERILTSINDLNEYDFEHDGYIPGI